jgi:predicted O-methyltransferase YrrM
MELLRVILEAPGAEGCGFPAKDKLEDRLLLFALVYGLKPKTCLEIGCYKGGSTEIIVAAGGKVFSIDPDPKISDITWEKIKDHCVIIRGYSPEKIGEAYALAKANFDFIFIDGDHDNAYDDIRGIMPYLANNAYILLHDCYYVANAIQMAVKEFNLIDCGILSIKSKDRWLGSQLLRHCVT